MKGTSTNNYDKKNHYIEVTAPIAIPGEDQIRGVMLASVSTDSIEDSLDVLYTQGSVIIGLVMIFSDDCCSVCSRSCSTSATSDCSYDRECKCRV